MSGGLDIESVLAESRCRDSHRPRWFGAYATSVPCVTCSEWAAHVAAVLREQIGTAQAEAWDAGYDARGVDISNEGLTYTSLTPNPYRAALVAPSRVPGEEG